jgi:hypothetical protein
MATGHGTVNSGGYNSGTGVLFPAPHLAASFQEFVVDSYGRDKSALASALGFAHSK